MPKLDDNRKIIILNYINEYYEKHNRTPAVRDISAGTGIPVTSVQRYLVALKESGALDYNGRRSIDTTRIKKEYEHYTVPILGSVSCGPGDYEEENIVEYIRVPVSQLRKVAARSMKQKAMRWQARRYGVCTVYSDRHWKLRRCCE